MYTIIIPRMDYNANRERTSVKNSWTVAERRWTPRAGATAETEPNRPSSGRSRAQKNGPETERKHRAKANTYFKVSNCLVPPAQITLLLSTLSPPSAQSVHILL